MKLVWVAALAAWSCALHRTVVVPSGNVAPLAGRQLATPSPSTRSWVSGVSYARVDDAGLHYAVDGVDHVLEVDHVVLCAGQESVRGLYDDLLAAAGAGSRPVHLVGGADVAAELDAKRAIEQGTRVAAAL